MAEAKASGIEREYIIPLKREWMKAANYKRTRKGVLAIKRFIAKHMKVEDRDLEKVKLDVYLNNEMWFRGSRKPPIKVKVKARREGDIVRVELAEMPEFVKFAKARVDKLHKKAAPKEVKVKEEPIRGEEQTEKEKKDEVEKEKAVEELNVKTAEQAAKAQKHTTKAKVPGHHRMALQK